jgi:hypothetical protein
MNENIRSLLGEIARLEEELATVIQAQQEHLHYRVEGSKVRFEEKMRRLHREMKTGVFAWLATSEWRNVASAPFIYAMIIPLLFLDIFVTVYQAVCFPLFGIPKIRRSNYIVVDRHHLAYLNIVEKINCVYCGYGDGLLAYTRQILCRTEMYWCPIKHARKILDPHRRYARFADFGDGEDLQRHVAKMRKQLAAVPANLSSGHG